MASKHIYGSGITYCGSIQTDELGIPRTEYDISDECFKSYVYVYLNEGTIVAVGDICTFIDNGTSVVGGTENGNRNTPAGVVISKADKGSYIWLQSGGFNSSVNFTSTRGGPAGEAVVVTANGANGSTIAVGTAPTCKPVGFIAPSSGKTVILCCADVSAH